MMKLFSQFEQVESATPLARREDGKISVRRSVLVTDSFRITIQIDIPEGMAHGTGPHEAPKDSM
jgi:hypothetical protein